MDIPLKKPRNTRLIRIRRFVLMGLGLFALVLGVGSIPVAFVYFASDSQKSETPNHPPDEAALLQEKRKQVIAFVNVNLLTMDEERILTAQTVVVKDGVIAALGDADEVSVPRGAIRVEGRGKFLMPGLADMHVHLEVFNDEVNSQMLKLFVANGVTTVLNLFGAPKFLALRERIATGEVLGPALYTSGPYVSNAPAKPPTAEEVEAAITAQKKAGYDIVKIHGDFSPEAYHKVFEVARREGLKVIGHLPRNLGIEAAFVEKQDAIAHAEEYLYAYFFFKPASGPADGTVEARLRWIADQAKRIPAVAESTAQAGIWVSPTLAVYHGIGLQVDNIDAVMKRPEMKFLPPLLASRFAPANNTYIQRFKKESAPVFLAQADLLSKLVNGLHQKGVHLLAGTDTPVPSVVPGFSLHDELRELVTAGLSPYEALKTATVNAAVFLKSDSFGRLASGKAADLILIDGNPLVDINNVARRSGVMIRGRWFTETELQKLIGGSASPQNSPSK